MDNIPNGNGSIGEEAPSLQQFHNEFSQINDSKEAEDVAYVEKNEGRDVALLRESTLQKEHETGLTERERENLEIGNMLVEEFPDAFKESLDKNGNKIFTTSLFAVQWQGLIYEQLLENSKGVELNDNIKEIAKKIEDGTSSQGKTLLQYLVNNQGGVHVSKYGIALGHSRGFDIDDKRNYVNYEESLKVFSEGELQTFFETLKFLDKVGKIRKELEQKKKEQKMTIDSYRSLAQQIKNNPANGNS
ncbi:MAG: hypothetical protein PHP08_03530 [Candidatus Dojkabacteria bacterium]|nr:hypothetical protein [Candidatus Dojkabacteria bacterium]